LYCTTFNGVRAEVLALLIFAIRSNARITAFFYKTPARQKVALGVAR
jgi:hypothetical protein